MNRDNAFEKEVRESINEVLLYVTAIQAEMFKEMETLNRKIRENTWNLAQREHGFETRKMKILGSSAKKKNSSPRPSPGRPKERTESTPMSHVHNLPVFQHETASVRNLQNISEMLIEFLKVQNVVNLENYTGQKNDYASTL